MIVRWEFDAYRMPTILEFGFLIPSLRLGLVGDDWKSPNCPSSPVASGVHFHIPIHPISPSIKAQTSYIKNCRPKHSPSTQELAWVISRSLQLRHTDINPRLKFIASMKVHSVALSLFFAAGFLQTTVGLKCNSYCAACWLDNNDTGVDLKIACSDDKVCIAACPSGYHGLHCATYRRCL